MVETLCECLGAQAIATIADAADTKSDLGLDSEDGIDFALLLSEKLGYEIPDHINPLVDDSHKRMRRVGEIVDLMCELTMQPQEANRG